MKDRCPGCYSPHVHNVGVMHPYQVGTSFGTHIGPPKRYSKGLLSLAGILLVLFVALSLDDGNRNVGPIFNAVLFGGGAALMWWGLMLRQQENKELSRWASQWACQACGTMWQP
jgi:peptidoglycan/LPS O-acetylase OafA/YrhL